MRVRGFAVHATLVGLVLGASVPASSAEEPRVCTAIGCVSGISVETRPLRSLMPEAYTVTACMDRRCVRAPARGNNFKVESRTARGPGPVRVRIVIRGRDGTVLLRLARGVRLQRNQPNGPDCPPICWSRGVYPDVRGRTIVALPH